MRINGSHRIRSRDGQRLPNKQKPLESPLNFHLNKFAIISNLIRIVFLVFIGADFTFDVGLDSGEKQIPNVGTPSSLVVKELNPKIIRYNTQ